MIDAPRTKAALCRLPDGSIVHLMGHGDIVRAEFARTLERELARLEKQTQAWERIAKEGHDSPCTFGSLCPYCEIESLRTQAAKKDEEIAQLRAEIGAIEAGLGKEYGPGDKRSGDLIDDFTEFLAHHKATEVKLAAKTAALEKAQEALAKMEKAGNALAFHMAPGPIPAESPTETDYLLAAWEEAGGRAASAEEVKKP